VRYSWQLGQLTPKPRRAFRGTQKHEVRNELCLFLSAPRHFPGVGNRMADAALCTQGKLRHPEVAEVAIGLRLKATIGRFRAPQFWASPEAGLLVVFFTRFGAHLVLDSVKKESLRMASTSPLKLTMVWSFEAPYAPGSTANARPACSQIAV